MNIVSIDNDSTVSHAPCKVLLLKTANNDADTLAKYALETSESIDPDAIMLVLPNDYSELAPDDRQYCHLLLTADDVIDELVDGQTQVAMYVFLFTDGRVFSLIHQLKNTHKNAQILVLGAFGLDQANYFYKSGANSFVVDDDKVSTISATLCDLQSAHFGQSVNALPMFR